MILLTLVYFLVLKENLKMKFRPILSSVTIRYMPNQKSR